MPENDPPKPESGGGSPGPRRGPGGGGKSPYPRRPSRGPGHPAKARPSQGPRRSGEQAKHPGTTGIRLKPLGGDAFELDHPPCVLETEPDYEEGLEIWKEGDDPEGARDALRYVLSACRDNLWVHVALGQIALKEFNDAQLALGHFGYAMELATLAIPPQFRGTIPPNRPNNRPLYDAIDGLIECFEKLKKPRDIVRYRSLRDAWLGHKGPSQGPQGRGPSTGPRRG